MIRAFVNWLSARLGADGPDRADEESPEEGSSDDAGEDGFLASPLDASVMFAHGADVEKVESEGDADRTAAEKAARDAEQAAREADRFHDDRH